MRRNAVIWTCFFVAAAYGQQQSSPNQVPPQDTAQGQVQPDLTDQRPLTPAEQREKRIRAYDPLDKSNPRDPRKSDNQTDQSEKDQNPTKDTSQPKRRQEALPGSVAASNQTAVTNPRSEGPEVVTRDSDLQTAQDYTGPAVLSRSYTLSRPMTQQQVKWSWSVGYLETYTSGLPVGATTPGGAISSLNSFGHSLRWSFGGKHFWKHDSIGLNYAGSQDAYAASGGYNGSNESLNLDYTHQFSRHLLLNLTESGFLYSTSYSLENPLGTPGVSVANLDLQSSPAVQLFDQGTKTFTSAADVTWQKTARLSFNFGGVFFDAARQGLQTLGTIGAGGYPGLYGNSGYQAKADVTYRYTRRTTLGIYYSFTNYAFAQHIDESDSHTIGAVFSYAFGKTMQLRTRAGVSLIENLGYTSVPLDPTVAVLTGRGSEIVDAYTRRWSPDVSAEFVKDFGRQRTMHLAYAHGISPGNGLQLTSTQENMAAGFGMRFLRRYTGDISVGKSSLDAIALNLGSYRSKYATLSISRPWAHGVTAVFSLDYRTYSVTNLTVSNETLFRISSGITWGPGEGKLW